jgi:hypothetical protein
MMDCLTQETLLRYVEAETSAAEAEEIKRHMEQCSRCRHEIDALQTLVLGLGQLAWPETPSLDANAECVEAMTLAAYIDQRLARPEREQVEQHFVSCQTCLDELMIAVQRLEAIADAPQPAPAHLLEQAIALEAAGKPVLSPWWYTMIHQIRERVAWLAPAPQWVWIGGSVAVIVMLALYVGLSPLREQTGSTVQIDSGRQPSGYGFGTSTEVLMQGNMRLSPALRSALLAYQAHPTSTSRDTLLALLGQESLRIPVDQVLIIEITPSLQATLTSALEARQTVQVTLLPDGLLVIEDGLRIGR